MLLKIQSHRKMFLWWATTFIGSISSLISSHSWKTSTCVVNIKKEQLSGLKKRETGGLRSTAKQTSKRISGTDGRVKAVLTWISADELWPGALLGRRGVGSANQLVLGHFGVGLGELQPQGLWDFGIKPDALRSKAQVTEPVRRKMVS